MKQARMLEAVGAHIRHLLSGAAISPQEFERLEPFIASLKDRDFKKKDSLQAMIKEAQSIIRGNAAAFGISPEDINFIEDSMMVDPNFVPSQIPDGMVVIGN